MTIKEKTYILGYAGFAKELYDQVILRDSSYDFGGFITLKDDKAVLINENSGFSNFSYSLNARFILGTGNKTWRHKFLSHFLKHYSATDKHFPNVFNNLAYISKIANIGVGNVFCPFTIVNADAKIGDFNLFNVYSSIHHDCVLGNHNILCPHSIILGNCNIGNNNFLGSHVTITPKRSIGNDNTISAGECVFDDLHNKEFFQSGVIYDKTLR